MPNDLVTLKALSAEMNDALVGGRIDKIGMPSEEEIVLMIRAKGVNRYLYFCCRSDMPRVHFSTQKFVNTPVPPNFCMLLRKHLSGGAIERVITLNEDRLVEFTIMTRNELNDATRFRLIIEIMGGASNVILCNDEYKILDAVKRVMNEHSRTVFPQATYTYPSKSKALLTDIEAVKEVIESADVKKVYGQINGLSKESALELIAVSKDCGTECAAIRLNDMYTYKGFLPSTQYDENGKCIGFFAYPYISRKEKGSYKTEVDLSSAIEAFYRESAGEAKKHRDTLKLNQKLKALVTKTERRIKDNLRTIEDSKNKDKFRELGEILKCNIYRVERGMSIIKCDDFYNTCEVEIALDPTISPQKNVEKYFKRYNKAKGAENYAKAEITKLYELDEYLKSIKASIKLSSTEAEYKDIKAELD
ncbi:MAG: NFACT family protein, partial [Clostridia bacterium]|nr:NFACT family protein [Clostridia bacterium]